MNQTRRNKIREIQDDLRIISERIEELRDEESAAYENMPESLQESEKGETAMRAVDILEQAIGEVDDSISTLEDIFED